MFDKKFKLLLNRVFSPDSIVFLTSYSPNNLNLQGSRTCLLPERQNMWPKKKNSKLATAYKAWTHSNNWRRLRWVYQHVDQFKASPLMSHVNLSTLLYQCHHSRLQPAAWGRCVPFGWCPFHFHHTHIPFWDLLQMLKANKKYCWSKLLPVVHIKKGFLFVNDDALLSPWTAIQILVVNYGLPDDHIESSWRLCLASYSHEAMLFKTRQQAILSVIRIKVDRDINIGRACRKATITLDEQHDNDNCFFFHSATVACFDILDQIFPSIVIIVGLWDQHNEMTEMLAPNVPSV